MWVSEDVFSISKALFACPESKRPSRRANGPKGRIICTPPTNEGRIVEEKSQGARRVVRSGFGDVLCLQFSFNSQGATNFHLQRSCVPHRSQNQTHLDNRKFEGHRR